jgi:hypothetical protein
MDIMDTEFIGDLYVGKFVRRKEEKDPRNVGYISGATKASECAYKGHLCSL